MLLRILLFTLIFAALIGEANLFDTTYLAQTDQVKKQEKSETPKNDQWNKNMALLAASKKGQLEEAKSLIASGAEVNTYNFTKRTPLIYAVVAGSPELVKFLLARGANVNVEDQDGDTPLKLAIIYDRKEIEKLLRAAGAK